jgi:glucose 1-dehydrogenase
MQSPVPHPDWLGLAGRVCVVTGAGSGIGAAIAAGLVQAGAHVALLDRDGDAVSAVAQDLNARSVAAEGAGATVLRPCRAYTADVSDEAAVLAVAQRVQAELGPCYGVVNNAGMGRPGALDSVSLQDWNRVLAVNLTGYLVVARSFAPQMRSQGAGSVVHVASISGLTPQTHSGAYSASKAGILLMSRQMAVEWGPQGLRSNAVCPGLIRTPLTAKFYDHPGVAERRAAITPSRRIGQPQDIADAVLYLLSPRAGFVNGAELLVDGGLSGMLMDLMPRPGYNDRA